MRRFVLGLAIGTLGGAAMSVSPAQRIEIAERQKIEAFVTVEHEMEQLSRDRDRWRASADFMFEECTRIGTSYRRGRVVRAAE